MAESHQTFTNLISYNVAKKALSRALEVQKFYLRKISEQIGEDLGKGPFSRLRQFAKDKKYAVCNTNETKTILLKRK